MTSLILGWHQNAVSPHTTIDGKSLSFDDATSKMINDVMIKRITAVMSQNNNFAELDPRLDTISGFSSNGYKIPEDATPIYTTPDGTSYYSAQQARDKNNQPPAPWENKFSSTAANNPEVIQEISRLEKQLTDSNIVVINGISIPTTFESGAIGLPSKSTYTSASDYLFDLLHELRHRNDKPIQATNDEDKQLQIARNEISAHEDAIAQIKKIDPSFDNKQAELFLTSWKRSEKTMEAMIATGTTMQSVGEVIYRNDKNAAKDPGKLITAQYISDLFFVAYNLPGDADIKSKMKDVLDQIKSSVLKDMNLQDALNLIAQIQDRFPDMSLLEVMALTDEMRKRPGNEDLHLSIQDFIDSSESTGDAENPYEDEDAQAYGDELIDKYLSGNLVDLNPWRSTMDRLMREATYSNTPAPRDPIILDLNGDGISTIASGGNTGQKFDFNDDGLKTAAGWVAPTDGVLGIDQNGDGKLTSGKELIGDQTELKDGRIAAHGYEVIADLDSNGDGVINALDPDFHKLRVWVDKNSDGISQADELFTLTDLGIIGLNLEHKMTSETLNGNNVLSHIGSYIKADGTTGLMGNVNFMPDDLYTEYVDKIPLTPEQAAMSNIGGLGRVRPLAEALTLSSDLRLKFDVYHAAATKAQQLEALEDLLLAWAETEAKFQWVSFEDAKYFAGSNNAVGSGGGATGGITLEPDPLKARWVAAEIKVSILNSFFNLEDRAFYKLPSQYVNKTWTNLAFNTNTLDTIDRIYHQLTSNMYMELLVETRLSSYLHQITVTEAGLDFTKVIALFDQVAMTNTRKAFVDLAEFITLFEDKKSVLSLISTLDRYAKLGVMSDGINDWMKELSLEVDAVKKLGLIVGALDNNFVVGTTVNDIILGSIGGKQISAGAGNDIIVVSSSNNIVDAGAGNDTIIVNSGSGTNRLIGQTGSDTYVFLKGHGQDIISDFSYTADVDTIKLTDVQASAVKFGRKSDDLILFGYNGSDRITVEKFFTYVNSNFNYAIEYFEFEDKTISYTDYFAQGLPLYALDDTSNIVGWGGANIIHAGSGTKNITTGNATNIVYTETADATVTGGSGKDTIYSGSGTNRLVGQTGSDTYVFVKGHGHDIISDFSYTADVDTIKLTDVQASAVKFGRKSDDLILFSYNGSDQITVEKFFTYVNSNFNYAIEYFEFEDKTISYTDYFAQGLPLYALDDTSNIFGWSGANIIYAGSGTKTITTGNATNVTYTETANVTVIGGSGQDTIYSGSGTNRLVGQTGSDTYVFSKGHGQDVIFDYGYTGELDTLKFIDVKSTDVKFGRSGDHLVVFGYNGSDQIMIEKFFTYVNSIVNYTIERFEFSDTTITYEEYLAQGLPLYALDETSNIAGWSGASIIHAGSGSKTITAGNGDNVIYTEAANTTTTTGSGNDTIILGTGNNVINAGSGNDTIYSGSGTNRLQGGAGSDTYVFSKGHGQDVIFDYGYTGELDTLKFTDVKSTDVKFGRSGDHLVVFGYNGSDQITIEKFFTYVNSILNYAIEVFEFSDKTISYSELIKTSIPAFTAEDQANLLAAQAELEAARTLSQVMSPASYLMMDELFANTAPTVGLSPMNAMASNEAQADIAKEVQSLICAMASFGATEGSLQIEDQAYGYLTPITVPS